MHTDYLQRICLARVPVKCETKQKRNGTKPNRLKRNATNILKQNKWNVSLLSILITYFLIAKHKVVYGLFLACCLPDLISTTPSSFHFLISSPFVFLSVCTVALSSTPRKTCDRNVGGVSPSPPVPKTLHCDLLLGTISLETWTCQLIQPYNLRSGW